ncbi:MMPL family transporter [Zafaria sp. Z1313]|uniref:MMPL family transporter n=1 Tax=Zafaria sp. Z1313 TaxID=3423202 RepID=UPI003D302C40
MTTLESTAPPRGTGSPRPHAAHGPARWLRVLVPAVLIVAWLVVLALGGRAFGQASAVSVNDPAEHLPASAEATLVHGLQDSFRDVDALPATLVFHAPDGLGTDQRAGIADVLAGVQGLDVVLEGAVSPARPSEDGLAAVSSVPLETAAADGTELKPRETVEALRAFLADHPVDGVQVYVAGPAGLSADIGGAFAGLDGLLLLTALGVVLLILVAVYRSPLLPLMVLGTSVAALTAAMAVAVALARADVLTLSGQTQGILMILVVGAATDYALLYVARYRSELARHARGWEATKAAWRAVVGPVAASGGTVIAGLLCLMLSQLNSHRAMGPVAALGIGFAMLAALTLLPALLLWAGRTAYWPLVPRPDAAAATRDDAGAAPSALDGTARRGTPGTGTPAGTCTAPAAGGARRTAAGRGLWAGVARLVARRPRTVWIATALVLFAGCLAVPQFKADGIAQTDFVIGATDSAAGQQVLAGHFPAGTGSPTLVVAPEDLGTGVGSALESDPGVALVSGPLEADGRLLFTATLLDAPQSPAAEATVERLRDAFDAPAYGGEVLVGGETAVALDTRDAAMQDRWTIMPLVLGVIALILVVLLRSIVAPLLLVASTVLSFGTAIGVSALVFNGILGFPGADASVPLYAFVFLVALGVDYNIFLMHRVREEARTHGTRPGILRGLRATGGVITSAGLVLAATFAALGVLPVLFLVQLGFIVAFGVLLDTIVVRSLLVPALAYELGDRLWWPAKPLGRAG